jgi:hypothetical protein
MMSSGVICGKFDKAKMLASVAKDTGDITFGEASQPQDTWATRLTGWTRKDGSPY